MDNLPPPALVAPAPAWVTELNGTPLWQVSAFTPKTARLVAVCWPDGAAPSGWQAVPALPEQLCFRPDLRTRLGQAWQKKLDTARWNVTPLAQDPQR